LQVREFALKEGGGGGLKHGKPIYQLAEGLAKLA
jgi:hypothetical protein